VVVTVLALMLPGVPAHAVNEPMLESSTPRQDASARSEDVPVLSATFDRDLTMPPSTFVLRNASGNRVSGNTYLSGSESAIGRTDSISFRPANPLDEALSPYRAAIHACPYVPGDCTNVSILFAIDDTPPAAPVVSHPSDGQTISDQIVVVQGSAEPGARLTVLENDEVLALGRADTAGSFVVELPYGNEDGVEHAIIVHAVDKAGNTSPESGTITFLHDSMVHPPLITAPTDGAILNTSAVTMTGTAKPGSTVSIAEGSSIQPAGTADNQGRWSATLTFAEGAHVVTASSFDGRETDGPSLSRTFTVDLTAPGAPIVATPVEGDFVSSPAVEVSGTAEPMSTIRVRDNGSLRATVAANHSGEWSASIQFTDGPRSLSITATDVAGNTGAPAARSFTVDTIAPPPPVISSPQDGDFLNQHTVAFSGTAEDGARVRLFEGQNLVGTTLADGAGSWSATASFPDGAHSIMAITVDTAGNASAPSMRTSFTVDTIAPAPALITSPSAGNTLNAASILVAGNAESGSTVVIREQTAIIGQTYANGAGDWALAISFTDGGHTIVAIAIDAAGNAAVPSTPRSFTINRPADYTAPDPPAITAPSIGSTQPGFVTFRGTAEPGVVVRVYQGSALVGTAAAGGSSGEWTFGQTLSEGAHSVRAVAFDAAGNASGTTPWRNFFVDATRPIVAVDGSGTVLVTPLDDPAVTGTATDNHGISRIELEIDNAITGVRARTVTASSCPECPGTPVTWRALLSLPPGVYTVRAYAVDLAGNRSRPASTTLIAI